MPVPSHEQTHDVDLGRPRRSRSSSLARELVLEVSWEAKQYLRSLRDVLALFLAFVAIASTFFPERWHEVTW